MVSNHLRINSLLGDTVVQHKQYVHLESAWSGGKYQGINSTSGRVKPSAQIPATAMSLKCNLSLCTCGPPLQREKQNISTKVREEVLSITFRPPHRSSE